MVSRVNLEKLLRSATATSLVRRSIFAAPPDQSYILGLRLWRGPRASNLFARCRRVNSEYVALYDSLRVIMAQGFLDFLLDPTDDDLDAPTAADDLFSPPPASTSLSSDPGWWLFGDNKSALHLANSTVVQKRSKHLNLRLHTVRDKSRHLVYVPTGLNKADGLTKAVPFRTLLNIYTTPVETVDEDDDFVDEFDESGVCNFCLVLRASNTA